MVMLIMLRSDDSRRTPLAVVATGTGSNVAVATVLSLFRGRHFGDSDRHFSFGLAADHNTKHVIAGLRKLHTDKRENVAHRYALSRRGIGHNERTCYRA